MDKKTPLQIWDLWFPQAASTGLPFARGRLAASDVLWVHAPPPTLTVEVRSEHGTRLAFGKNLAQTADCPMTMLTRQGAKVSRQDGWPTQPLLKKPVKNDLSASRNVILLTGPNMSGKSTLLKAVSLCVYLGHTGLAVPASKVIMPFFTTISVAINLTDSIVSGYSHFMSEIIALKNVLSEAERGARCFAVFDELFRGTNIEDALEISTATIKGIVKFPNSLFLISTHLHQLKEIEEIKNGKVTTCYIECELNNNIPAFTYKLKSGWSDLKLGRILFEKEGLYKMLE